MRSKEWASLIESRALGRLPLRTQQLSATVSVPKRSGVMRKQPLIVMGERRLYNFSLNTKKASKQNGRFFEDKKAPDAEHHSQEQQSAEKVSKEDKSFLGSIDHRGDILKE